MNVQMGADACGSANVKLRAAQKRRADAIPLPEDFVKMAAILSPLALRRHYGIGTKPLERWYHLSGAPRMYAHRPPAPVPADFAQVAPALTKQALQERYQTRWETVTRWCKEAGVTPAKQEINNGAASAKPVPDDFHRLAPTMTLSAMERHYHVHAATVARWCRVSGVSPAKYKRGYARPSGPVPSSVPAVDGSYAAQAAQFLRKRSIVYRCDILTAAERAKLPNHGRGLWYINGRGAVPEAEMIALAESKGFDRLAWARI